MAIYEPRRFSYLIRIIHQSLSVIVQLGLVFQQSDGVETNDDDLQQADIPSEIDVTSPPPPPSKHSSETKKNKRHGVRANDLYSYFSMCTCPTDYHKRGSKSS
jgi:hypothetical protein